MMEKCDSQGSQVHHEDGARRWACGMRHAGGLRFAGKAAMQRSGAVLLAVQRQRPATWARGQMKYKYLSSTNTSMWPRREDGHFHMMSLVMRSGDGPCMLSLFECGYTSASRPSPHPTPQATAVDILAALSMIPSGIFEARGVCACVQWHRSTCTPDCVQASGEGWGLDNDTVTLSAAA